MPVSYLSKIYESNPYLIPVDLNLLQKVNSYKQTKFYENASAINSQLNQLYSADIANKNQRDLLHNKVNSLTSQINDMGGLDYSDVNIANTVSSYGSEIYNDPNIIEGISSTAKLRKRQSYYEKIKTDPKLSKFYNPVNEMWDSRKDDEYINGGLDASYTGPTTPTLYKGNPYTRLMEAVKTLKPDIDVNIDPISGNPYYFSKTEHKYLSPDKVFASIQGSLDADIMNQLKIDAWGNMRDLGKDKLESLFVQNHNKSISNIDAEIENSKNKMDVSADEKTKKFYKDRITSLEQQKKESQDNFDLNGFRESIKSEDGWINAMSNIYTQSVVDNAIKANTHEEYNRSLIVNVEQLQKDKFALEEYKARLEAEKEKKKKFGTEDGSLMTIDTNYENTQELDNEKLNIDNIKKANASNDSSISATWRSFFINNASGYHRSEGEKDYLGMGREDFLKKLGDIEGLDKKLGLDISDVREALKQNMLTGKAKDYFNNVVSLYDRAASGDEEALKGTDFSQSEFINTYKNVTLLKEANDARNDLLKEAHDYAKKKYIAKHGSAPVNIGGKAKPSNNNEYLDLGDTFSKGNVVKNKNIKYQNTVTPNGQIISVPKESSFDITTQPDYTKYINEYLEDSAYRKNYYKKYLNNQNFEKSGDVKSFLQDKAGLTDIDFNKIDIKSISQIPKSSDDFTKGKNSWYVTFQYQDGKDFTTTKVAINEDEAKRFGVASNPYYELDNVLLYKESTNPYYASTTKNDRFGSPIFKYYINKPKAGDVNSNKIKLVVFDDNGSTINVRNFKYNNQKVSFDNATQAMTVFEELVRNASQAYSTREDFFNALRNYQND